MGRTIIIILVIAIAGLLLYNHNQTGEWSFRVKKLSPEDTEMIRLENELKEVEKELASVQRQARASGGVVPQVMMTEIANLQLKQDELRSKIRELKEAMHEGI